MLVCDSNVRGIRERNKLGLIIMSADVNPYKNKSSLLFFSPPDRSDDLSWLQLSWSTLFLHSCAQHITCAMSTCRVSFIRLAVTTDLTEERLIQDRLHWRRGVTQKKKAEPTVKFTFTAFYRTSYSHVRATPPWKQQIPQMNAAFGTSFFSLTIF